MKIIKVREFNIEADADEVLEFNGNKQGDTVTSEVYVQTADDISFSATGYVKDGEEGVSMKLLNVGTFETVDAPTEAGLYLVMAGALQSLKLSFTAGENAVKVIVKEVF